MTSEIPEQPPRSGEPTRDQARTAMYVLEWLRDEWDRDGGNAVINDAHYWVQLYEKE